MLCHAQSGQKPDKISADSLLNIGIGQQNSGKHGAAIISFEQSVQLYKALDEQEAVGIGLTKMGNSYYFQGEYTKALSYFEKSISAFSSINNKKGISSAVNNIGAIYFYLGNYLKALSYYKRALAIHQKLEDKKNTAIAIQNIGGIYFKIGDYKSAMSFYNRAYAIIQKIDEPKQTSKILNNIGLVFMKQKDFKRAQQRLDLSLKIANEIKDSQMQIEALSSLGELYYFQKNLSKSLYYYRECLKIAETNSNMQYQSTSLIGIGNIHHLSGNFSRAITRCGSGLKIAEELSSLSAQKEACECLYKAHKGQGNADLALKYFEKSLALHDSLQSEKTSESIMKMEFQNQQLVDSLAQVKKNHLVNLRHTMEISEKEEQRNYIIVTLCFIVLISAGLWNRLQLVRRSRAALKIEKDNSERLLLNILPEEIAEELKTKGFVSAKNFSSVSILFTDFKSFTQTAEKLSPQELVGEINVCFKAFDQICEKYNIEKIKTIGDSYMAAGGIPRPYAESFKNIVSAGIEMQQFMMSRKREREQIGEPSFEMRLGIHAGPIIAGIVGLKKFQYDVWGDTVNTASRIESSGQVGKVNISESMYELVKNEALFSFEDRGMQEAKGKGEIKMYFVTKKSYPEN